MFSQCLKICSNHVYRHNVCRHIYNMFTPFLKTCLHDVRTNIYTIFEDMFTPCFETCSLLGWKHIVTMFETCVNDIWRHIITDMLFAQYLKPYFYNVWRHDYTMFEDMFSPHSNSCLHHVWNHISSIFTHSLKKVHTMFVKTVLISANVPIKNSYS